MNDERLAEVVSTSAATAMRCLAAAEHAVLTGRFNLAKVLRACAHAARLTSLTAARTLSARTPPAAVLAEAGEVLMRAWGPPPATPPGPAVRGVVDRALRSLEGNRDVLESDVAQSLWGCQVCGAIFEDRVPDRCGSCGALRFEFEWFGPFYSGTFERLGRQSPDAIQRIVHDSPARLAALVAGVEEENLARRPSPDEWGIKEIAGHLIDVTELFSWRVLRILVAASPPSLDGPVPPWRLLEGKGYAQGSTAAIVEGFRGATRDALEMVAGLDGDGWGRFGLIGRRVTTILDLGTWLANHNIAHLAQIEALRPTRARAAAERPAAPAD
jgi:hypothetical protein